MYDESSPEPSTQPDTDNHTKFHAADGDYDGLYRLDGSETFESFYNRLSSYNTGIRTRKWADQEKLRAQDNLAIFDAIAGRLELTRYQHQRAREAFSTISLADLSSPGGVDTPLVAICVAAIFAREDGRMYHPNRGENTNDPLFVDLIDELDYPTSAVKKCYGKVLHRVDL